MKLVLTYVDSEELAEKVANALLTERLAACVGFWEGKSRYWWKGRIEKVKEFTLIIKTKKSLVEETINKIKQIHTYELPIIDVIDVEKNNLGAEEWLNEVTKKS